MTPTEVLDALDAAEVPYVVRDGAVRYRTDAELSPDLAAAIEAQRRELATEALAWYAAHPELDRVWHCHHCRGLVRIGTGRLVHPPDWPHRRQDSAPIMHAWCFSRQPWWRLDVDDPLAPYAELIALAHAGRLPGGVTLQMSGCRRLVNPNSAVGYAADRLRRMGPFERTGPLGADALELLDVALAWLRSREERRAAA